MRPSRAACSGRTSSRSSSACSWSSSTASAEFERVVRRQRAPVSQLLFAVRACARTHTRGGFRARRVRGQLRRHAAIARGAARSRRQHWRHTSCRRCSPGRGIRGGIRRRATRRRVRDARRSLVGLRHCERVVVRLQRRLLWRRHAVICRLVLRLAVRCELPRRLRVRSTGARTGTVRDRLGTGSGLVPRCFRRLCEEQSKSTQSKQDRRTLLRRGFGGSVVLGNEIARGVAQRAKLLARLPRVERAHPLPEHARGLGAVVHHVWLQLRIPHVRLQQTRACSKLIAARNSTLRMGRLVALIGVGLSVCLMRRRRKSGLMSTDWTGFQ